MWRGLKRVYQQLPRALTFQSVKLVSIDDNDGVAAMQRYVLRAVAVRKAHEFAKPRFRVLKAPTAKRWLCRGGCFTGQLSSHADQISTMSRLDSSNTSPEPLLIAEVGHHKVDTALGKVSSAAGRSVAARGAHRPTRCCLSLAGIWRRKA